MSGKLEFIFIHDSSGSLVEGNWNRVLFANLSSGEIWEDHYEPDVWKENLGGVGLGLFIFEKIAKYVAPLSPDNPLVFTVGPLTGTVFPNTGRYSVVSRSPLNGAIAEGNGGGFIGNEIKRAGFDAIVILGAADAPSILRIGNKIRIEERPELWGKNYFHTEAKLRSEDGSRVAGIGRAGENCISIAAIINDGGRAVARGGLGAVMGSKKLKAITVRGGKEIPLDDQRSFFHVSRRTCDQLVGLTQVNSDKNSSTAYDSPVARPSYSLPRKDNDAHCANCVTGCPRAGGLKWDYLGSPEPQTIASLLPFTDGRDFEQIARWNYYLNDAGLDTLSMSKVLSILKLGIHEDGLTPSGGNREDHFVHKVEDIFRNVENGDASIMPFVLEATTPENFPDLLGKTNKKQSTGTNKITSMDEIYNSLIVCKFAKLGIDTLSEALRFSTGLDYSSDSLLASASLIAKRRESLNKKMDEF